jgi:hypothetical protein
MQCTWSDLALVGFDATFSSTCGTLETLEPFIPLTSISGAYVVRMTDRAHNVSHSIGEGFLTAFLASVIAGYFIDSVVMALRTTNFPGSYQTSPR